MAVELGFLLQISVYSFSSENLVDSFQISVVFESLRDRFYSVPLVENFVNLQNTAVDVYPTVVRNLRTRAQNFTKSERPFNLDSFYRFELVELELTWTTSEVAGLLASFCALGVLTLFI